MELEVFAGQEKSELSMIEVARAILEVRGRDHEMHFSDLVNEIQNYLGTSNSDIREALPLFYTELNFDGSFISLGDNKWGLRSWYGVDEIDEEIIALEETDEDETPKKRKKKRVNAFMDGDEDAIDYNDDDPEDEELLDDEDLDSDDLDDDIDVDLDDDVDEEDEIDAYRSDLNELGADEDLVDEASVEEDLIIIDDEDLDKDFDEEDEEE